MSKLNEYEQRDKEQAEELCKEIKSLDIPCRVEMDKSDYPVRFHVIAMYNEHDFRIHKEWHGYVQVNIEPYNRYEGVSSHAAAELRKEIYTSNRMKVMTEKKLIIKMDEELKMAEAMSQKAMEHHTAHAKFLDIVDKHKPEYNWDYTYDDNNERHKDKIIGGEIKKNGILFSFEFSDNGYISQIIKIDWKVKHNLKSFNQLSENKWKPSKQ